jgi:dUTPase
MQLFVYPQNEKVKIMYANNTSNNLFISENITIQPNSKCVIDLQVKASLKKINTSLALSINLYEKCNFWVIPNEYLNKTTLISVVNPVLCNENDNIIVTLYNYSVTPFCLKKGMALFQIVPGTESILQTKVV